MIPPPEKKFAPSHWEPTPPEKVGGHIYMDDDNYVCSPEELFRQMAISRKGRLLHDTSCVLLLRTAYGKFGLI